MEGKRDIGVDLFAFVSTTVGRRQIKGTYICAAANKPVVRAVKSANSKLLVWSLGGLTGKK